MIEYEWSIEERTVYDDGEFDIEDHDFADSLSQYADWRLAEVDCKKYVLTLIRKYWQKDGRNWEMEEAEAYRNECGMLVLPDKMKDVDGRETRKVPMRFHGELSRRQGFLSC